MARLLVLGWGNTLRGDDGVGHLAAERLLERYEGEEQVEVVPLLQLTLDHCALVAEAERVWFLDASAVGEVGQLERRPVLAADEDPPAPHAVSPATLLALARELYKVDPVCELITVAGLEFEHGETLHPAVAEGLEAMVNLVSQSMDEELACCVR